MAVLDPHNDCVVVRIVYDGAPLAGKTTSIAALGRGLGAGVYSPADLDGRTLFFDWLDYTGGLFEGRRIRCQVVSVPGQATLAPRRRRLLESADAVVFVGDSSPAAIEADRRYLSGLQAVLQSLSGPPVGVVLQANKRDLPDATPLDQLRGLLSSLQLRIGVVESVAAEGVGVREAFVFAVRLALDRVRELMRTGELASTRPRIDSAQELLAELQQAEDGMLNLATADGLVHTKLQDVQPDSVAVQAFKEVIHESAAEPEPATAVATQAAPERVRDRSRRPVLPDERVASGLIWPPVNGRLILHETTGAPVLWQGHSDGGWSAVVDNRWRVHSGSAGIASTLEEGRAMLLQWARVHAASQDVLSKDRCIVLAADEDEFRVWQFIRLEQSLRTLLENALIDSAARLATTLLSVVRSYMHVAELAASAACELPLNLDSVGLDSAAVVFVGFMPEPSAVSLPKPWSREQASEQLMSELVFAQPTLRARRNDLLAALARLSRSGEANFQPEWPILRRLVALTQE